MGYRLRQTLVGTRKRKAPAFLVFQSLKDAGLNGFSVVTTLSSLASLRHTLLLLWQEPRQNSYLAGAVCYMVSSCCLQEWADGKPEHLRGACTFTCHQCLFYQETGILCPQMGTCMLIAFLDLCFLTCVPFHGKWVIQN